MPDRMPDFRILVGGKPLDIDPRHLNQLIVDESLEMTAKCEFSIQHSHAFVLRPEWVMPGMRVEIQMGYVGDLVKVFAGDIATLEPEFPQDGNPSIKITAYDLSYKLKRNKRTEVFTPANLSDLVRTLVNDSKMAYGLQLCVSPGEILSNYALTSGQSLTCDNKADWEILNDIAAIGDYNIFVKFGIGTADPSRFYLYIVDDNYLLHQQNFRLRMIYSPGQDDLQAAGETVLLKFNPKFQTAGKKGAVETGGWGDDVAEVYGKAGLSDIGQENLMQIWEGVEKIIARRSTAENKPANSYQAKIATAADLRRTLKNLVTGDAVMAGNPRVQMGQEHEIVLNALGDFGRQYSGKYMLKRVVHSISPDEGFKTTFDVRRGGLNVVNR